ncbi:hypothetical protein H0H93_016146, partial [Arthromyces matolae]
TFTFAATDTTSNALSRTLHLLALNQTIQHQLRAEVTEALNKHAGEITYDDLHTLPFMDAICRETLRLMTFWGGGRACIGFKFSQLEMKVILTTLIEHFHFYPYEKEIVWQMTDITTPTVKGSPELPQLPLRMELIENEA